ncbi:MAG: YihY/virulence factor BrkB family protein [bacterium]
MRASWRRKLDDLAFRTLWGRDVSDTSFWGRVRAFLLRLLRLLYGAVRKFSEGQLTLQAMSLVYTTLLAFVPLLAVSFSVLKAFGVHNQIEPLLRNFLAPFGPKAGEITRQVTGFVENIKVGVLGSIGSATLIYTVISLLQKIENAFNSIWQVKRARGLLRKFSDYMSVISIGPLLVFSAVGSAASFIRTTAVQKVVSLKPFGMVFYLAGRLIPSLFICASFTFIYLFIPNTRVRFKSALAGGLSAGILWEGTGWAFASFMVSSTKYAAIYSGFAIIVLFMIWLYFNWLIVLIGAQISFYHQYPGLLSIRQEALLSDHQLREKLVFSIMFLISDSYYHHTPPWTIASLVRYLNLPVGPLFDMLDVLGKKGFIVETSHDPPSYLPARDIETITLKSILSTVRNVETGQDSFFSISEVDGIMRRMDEAIKDALGEKTIKDLVLSQGKKGDHAFCVLKKN